MRREATGQKPFNPFKIVIETAKERNILTSLANRIPQETINHVADVWHVGVSEVQFILNAFEAILQEKE